MPIQSRVVSFPDCQSDVGHLLQQIACKDEAALTELYQATASMARRYIRRFVDDSGNAEEVLQDVYWHVWVHAGVYDATRGTPRAWLFMILRSRAIDSLRRNRKSAAGVELASEPGLTAVGDTGTRLQEIWRSRLIRETLGRLSAAEHHFIRLAFFDGFTHAEIAQRTGIPLGTVKSRIRKALRVIREALPPRMESVW